jgi:hypothetical protein
VAVSVASVSERNADLATLELDDELDPAMLQL